MNQTNGYIYVRNHPSYDVDDACKMGKANNIPERDTQYATGEIKRGYFEAVFEVPIEKMGIVERLLQNEFRELNVKYDAGTEFYNKKIITLIEPYLITLGIKYKKLTKQESYYELCERDNRLSKESKIVFKGQFTNWIEYLSIERVYYDLKTCKNKVGEYLSNETNIDFEFTNITKSLKILDNMFPPYDLWGEYYDINDLTEIIKHNKNEELVEF
jgi:hypothetical protein